MDALDISGLWDRFNPRPCARGDAWPAANGPRPTVFQSAPLREGRRANLTSTILANAFQSAPLREGRLADADLTGVKGMGVSIRAPARGATAR